MTPRLALVVTGLLALPAAAAAEGARLVFDCTGPDGTAARFVIAPQDVDAAGRGPASVTYDGEIYEGLASSHRGPFQFGTDTDHFALLIHAETAGGRLAVELHHATETSSTLTPFTCETDF
jgi:hypothetical protein